MYLLFINILDNQIVNLIINLINALLNLFIYFISVKALKNKKLYLLIIH